MDNIQIFTFGQLDTFKAILEALSVMFDPTQSNFFVSSDGLGAGMAALLASLLAILGLFGSYFAQSKFNGAGPLLGLVLYVGLCIPKIPNVWITDLYTGQTELVTDVPVGIATMGYAMSTISKGLIDQFEQEYSKPGMVGGEDFLGSLTAGNGFLSPLKLMMALRQSVLSPAPQHLIFNVASYTRYCLYQKKVDMASAPPFYNPSVEMKSSDNPIEYFLSVGIMNTAGFAERMNPADNSESLVTCDALRLALSAAAPGGLGYYLQNPNSFGQYAFKTFTQSTEAFVSQCYDSNCPTAGDATARLNSSLNTVLGSMNANDRYMQIRLMQEVDQLVGSTSSLEGEAIGNVTTSFVSSIEMARMTEAVEGETFLHFMIPAMNSMMYLFYALFPLVMIVMVTKGAQSFIYLGGYMVFGLWVYSWMPVASVINFSITAGVIESFNLMKNELPLSVNSLNTYVQQAMDAVAVGSNLLAATPVITLAIISGSMFALTSVASGAANPTGNASDVAKQTTPQFSNSPSLVTRPSAFMASDGHNAAGGGSAAAMNRLGGYKSSYQDIAHIGAQQSQQHLDAKASTVGGSILNTFGYQQGAGRTINNTSSSNLSVEGANAISSATQTSLNNQLSETKGWSREKMQAAGAYISNGFSSPVGAAGHLSKSDKALLQTVDTEAYNRNVAEELSQSDSLRHLESAISADSNSNTVGSEGQRLLSDINDYKAAQQFAKQSSEEFGHQQQTGWGVELKGTDIHDQIMRTNPDVSDYGDMVGHLSGYVNQASQEMGLDSSEASERLNQFKNEVGKQNAHHFGNEKSTASAMVSAFTALDNLKASAKYRMNSQDLSEDERNQASEEYTFWNDAQSNLLRQSRTSNYAGYVHDTASGQADKAKAQIENSTLSSTVSDNISKTQQEVKAGKQELKSPEKFHQQELSDFRNHATAFDKISTSSSGSRAFSQSYAKEYLGDNALDRASAGEYGTTFGNLEDSQKREVLANQNLKMLNAFSNDFKNNLSQLALSSSEQEQYGKSLNSLVGSYNSHHDFIKSNNHGAHGKGTVALGELEQLSRITHGIGQLAQGAATQAHINSSTNEERGRKERESISNRGALTNEGWLGVLSGKNDGVDGELINPITQKLEQSQQDFGTSRYNQESVKQQMNELLSTNGASNWFTSEDDAKTFRDTFNSYIDQNHSPMTAFGLSLDRAGINQTGALQNGIDYMTGLGIAGAGANIISDDIRTNTLESSVEGQKALQEQAEKYAKKGIVGKAITKLGGPIGGAAIGLGMAAADYDDIKTANKIASTNLANQLTQGSIFTGISHSSLEKQEAIRTEMAARIVNANYQGSELQKAEAIDKLYQNKVSQQELSGYLTMARTSVNGQEPMMTNEQVVNLYNDVSREFGGARR